MMTMTRYVLADLPVSVRGFVKEDETGEPVYILNARLTREMNLETIRHEDAISRTTISTPKNPPTP